MTGVCVSRAADIKDGLRATGYGLRSENTRTGYRLQATGDRRRPERRRPAIDSRATKARTTQTDNVTTRCTYCSAHYAELDGGLRRHYASRMTTDQELERLAVRVGAHLMDAERRIVTAES